MLVPCLTVAWKGGEQRIKLQIAGYLSNIQVLTNLEFILVLCSITNLMLNMENIKSWWQPMKQ